MRMLPSEQAKFVKYRPVKPEEGRFSVPVPAETTCGRCRSPSVVRMRWHSNVGGFVDDKFVCSACGYAWWVENVAGVAARLRIANAVVTVGDGE